MKTMLAALLALLLLPLSGCEGALAFLPYAREIDNMALMRTLGVDAGETGLRVTASSGVQNQGSQPATVLTRESGTISGACLSMQAEGSSYLYYGHVGQILIGEDQARQGVIPSLDYVLRDPEMRLDTTLYIVRGATAQKAISTAADGGSSAAQRLEAMEEDAGLLSHATPRTVRQVLEDLADTGGAYAPFVTLTQEGDKTVMSANGYALFRDDKLVGWAEGDAARGVNLIQSRVDADVVELELPGLGTAALRVVGAKTQVKPLFKGDKLTGLSVTCTVEANLGESPTGLDLQNLDQRQALGRRLAEVEQARISAALDLAQTLRTDYLALKSRAGLAAPWHWRQIQAQWDLEALPIEVEVSATVRRGYDLDQ